ncbi:MAG: hypothetical protein ACKVKF_23950, partial [Rhodobacterales bacterium]
HWTAEQVLRERGAKTAVGARNASRQTMDGSRPTTTTVTANTTNQKELTMTPDRENIRFNVLRNALYHTARRRTLERWSRIFNFMVVVLGAAAVGNVVEIYGIPQHWVGMSVAIIGALQLVFDFGRQARDHQTLQRDYFSLLAEIEAAPSADSDTCAGWYSQMIRISADEPPILRALDAKAYNDALDASGSFDSTERLEIPFFHRCIGGFVAFEGYNFRKLSEVSRG